MNADFLNSFYNNLPDAAVQNACFYVLENTGNKCAQVWKKAPNGKIIARYTNTTNKIVTATDVSLGADYPPFCQAQPGMPCPSNYDAPNMTIPPGDSVFLIQAPTTGRWIPIRHQDENLVQQMIVGVPDINEDADPLATVEENPPPMEERLTDLFKTTGFKILAAAVILFAGYKFLKAK